MALSSLSYKRIGETIDYLGFALDNAVISGEPQEMGMAAYYAASVQLLYGNLSLSKKLAERAQRHFLEAGSPDWADRSRFLEGRLAFESGYYQQAIELFEDILKNPYGDSSSEKINLLETWAYRAKLYVQKNHCNQPQSPHPNRDALLFALEGLYMSGEEYNSMAEKPLLPGEEGFIYTEQPDWRSGFAQCELLFFTWENFWKRMFGAWYSLVQCRLSPKNSEEAIITMQQVIRDRQFPEIDPHDIFYYYACYQVYEHVGANRVDISTAASLAFKRLQSRASRIDDMETYRHYSKQQYWNKALGQAAVKYMLV
jgi:tetratricopeptide (TPR) repeat protein